MDNVKQIPIKRKQTAFSVKSTAVSLVYFACGILISRGAVMGNLAPFGVSLAAAAPKKRLLPSLIGAAFGYILLSPSSAFRYVAAVVSVGCLRWLTSELPRIRKSALFAPLAAGVPLLATGLALLFGSSSTLSLLSDCVVEASLGSAAAYFMSVTVKLAEQGRGVGAFSARETACVVITGCVLLLALGSIEVEGVSLGRILAGAAVLICAYYGGVGGGAVSGAASGAVFSIADTSKGYYCGGFAFGGLTAGLLAPLGKLWSAAAFLLSGSLMSLAFGGSVSIAPVIAEGVVSAVLFLIMPKELGELVAPLFDGGADSPLSDSIRRSVVTRLDFAARAVSNVKNDVEKVSEKLSGLYSPDFKWVCESVAGEVCAGCGLRMYCFEREKDITADDFARMEERLRANTSVTEKDVEEAFVKACCKKGEIARSMTENYRELCRAADAGRRVGELRGVVAGQFSGLSEILGDMARELDCLETYDSGCSERVKEALGAMGLAPLECVCMVAEDGRMRIELTLADKGKLPPRGALSRELSSCCGRRLDLPNISREGGKIRAAFCEMPVFDVEIGSDQHIAGGGKLCGDCIDYFNDGSGKTYALVCDGMGTGGRAAVDGEMAASVMGRLIRSGLSPDSSLQIVNSALMVKSEDESLSTVDLAAVDLYTGGVTLKKAGAPATFVRKGGRVLRLEKPSLPAGILNGIKFSTDTVKLSSGDMIVMVSDGVISGDEKWLEKLIKSWNRGSTQELAGMVVSEALRRSSSSREDDVTALVIRLTDNSEE